MPEVLLTSGLEGEKGYWLHPPPSRSRGTTARQARLRRDFGVAGVAINRFDNTVLAQQLEEVTE